MEAVRREPVSALKFPANREKTGTSAKNAPARLIGRLVSPGIRGAGGKIPCTTKQGMAGRKQGRKCFQSCPYQGEAFAESKMGASQAVELNRADPYAVLFQAPSLSAKKTAPDSLETKEKRASP